MAGLMAASATGCASGPAVRKSSKQLKAMEVTANQGRQQFFKQNYSAAEQCIQPFTTELHASKPLYECELTSIALLAGNEEQAEAHIREAVRLLEKFFDAQGERSAASIWGNEGKKVYKGDPYERALLYAFYGMFLLERGEVDNALAAFKRALLMDGDTQNHQYQSDFGLIQVLAAKCHDLLGEADQRDVMLAEAFKSAMAVLTYQESSVPKAVDASRPNRLSHIIQQEYDASGRAGGVPSPWVSALASWGGMERVRRLGGASAEALAWLEQHLPTDKGLGFNTLLVGWDGYGPSMVRTGEYGEKRIIVKGEKADRRLAYSAKMDDAVIDGWPWLGNVTYQAVTQGGRKMDNILDRQAMLKGTFDKSGKFMIAGGAAGVGVGSSVASLNNGNSGEIGAIIAVVSLAIMLVGFVFKGVQYAINTEADTRCWQCLPHELNIMPLTLPDGQTDLAMTAWIANYPVTEKKVTVQRKPGAAVTLAHVALPSGADPLAKLQSRALFLHYAAAPETVGANSGGEVSQGERQQVIPSLLSRYDANNDGELSHQELSKLQAEAFKAMRLRLGFAQ